MLKLKDSRGSQAGGRRGEGGEEGALGRGKQQRRDPAGGHGPRHVLRAPARLGWGSTSHQAGTGDRARGEVRGQRVTAWNTEPGSLDVVAATGGW